MIEDSVVDVRREGPITSIDEISAISNNERKTPIDNFSSLSMMLCICFDAKLIMNGIVAGFQTFLRDSLDLFLIYRDFYPFLIYKNQLYLFAHSRMIYFIKIPISR